MVVTEVFQRVELGTDLIHKAFRALSAHENLPVTRIFSTFKEPDQYKSNSGLMTAMFPNLSGSQKYDTYQ